VIASVPTKDLIDIAKETGLPVGLMRDLTLELLSKESSAEEPHWKQSLIGLLVEKVVKEEKVEEEGVVATLTLELMPRGKPMPKPGDDEALYPIPELAFVQRANGFPEAEKSACQYVRGEGLWPKGFDVRWSLDRRDGKPLPPVLEGNSLGGAFALGLAKLFSAQDVQG